MHIKIKKTFIDNGENFWIVMPMYDLLVYSDNYSITLESLRNCYKDEIKHDENENGNDNNTINSNKTIASEIFWI